MSWHSADDPIPGDRFSCDAIKTLIVPRSRDLGSFAVRRALPSTECRMVGPFIFFDQMGPSEFLLGQGMDVRPHPHIGLSTVTYLFEGEIMHRDSLGTALPIRPGELNWMTAGRGITHSERTGSDLRRTGSTLFGLQSWVALSGKDEETAPAFEHYEADALPILTGEGKTVRLIAGEAFGAKSPVRTSSPMVYADVRLEAGAVLPLDPTYDERAIYTIRPGPAPRLPAGRPDQRAGDRDRPLHGPGRRADGRPAPSLVELRLLAARADRAGQGGLAPSPLRHRAGGIRVHPPARAAGTGALPVSRFPAPQ
jgi:redox-sensitive bicupin YhaK (pirin superfamily)